MMIRYFRLEPAQLPVSPDASTFLHDVASLLGADAVLLGEGWEESEYLIALLAAARACQKPVLDAVTRDESEMGVFVWRCQDEIDVD